MSKPIAHRGSPTDTALGVEGQIEWHVAFLEILGVSKAEADGTVRENVPPGASERYEMAYRVCSACAAKPGLPAPVLIAPRGPAARDPTAAKRGAGPPSRRTRLMALLADMSKYCTAASAQFPLGWVRGVVKEPRQAAPVIHGATWTAWATGDGRRVEGHGDTAEGAMADLANQPRRIRQDQNG